MFTQTCPSSSHHHPQATTKVTFRQSANKACVTGHGSKSKCISWPNLYPTCLLLVYFRCVLFLKSDLYWKLFNSDLCCCSIQSCILNSVQFGLLFKFRFVFLVWFRFVLLLKFISYSATCEKRLQPVNKCFFVKVG